MADNAFTANGRVKAPVGVTPVKLKEMKSLVEATLTGDRAAKGRLEEVLTSTDAIFSYSHLTALNFLPQYDRAPRTWTQLAGTRTVSDFRKPVLYSMAAEWSDLGNDKGSTDSVAPVIPEGAPYPFAHMSGEESKSGGIRKRGFQTAFTFEAFINDSINFIQSLPGEMLRVALETEEYEVYGALLDGVTAAQQVAGGKSTDGTTVTANPVFSRAALDRALIEHSNRKINGRQVVVTGGYNLVVPVGQARFVNFLLNQTMFETQSGSNKLSVNGFNPFADVTVVETQYVTGNAWYILPKPGATSRPVLDRASLVGHEAPELRVEGQQGNYVGGGAVSPFEGSFTNDDARFRLRVIGGGILWSPDLVIYSTGAAA